MHKFQHIVWNERERIDGHKANIMAHNDDYIYTRAFAASKGLCGYATVTDELINSFGYGDLLSTSIMRTIPHDDTDRYLKIVIENMSADFSAGTPHELKLVFELPVGEVVYQKYITLYNRAVLFEQVDLPPIEFITKINTAGADPSSPGKYDVKITGRLDTGACLFSCNVYFLDIGQGIKESGMLE